MTCFADAMPNMLRHLGEWEGTYTHYSRDGHVIDRHHTWTKCEFPSDGDVAYVQSNRMTWEDGRIVERSFGGVFRDGLLHWDTDRFVGTGWETREGTVMLRLDRKDEPGVHFIEMINLADDGQTRSRTWQWFEGGAPTRRTLCDERRVGDIGAG